jgi:hypothetical protein
MPINKDKNILKNITFLKVVAEEIQQLADDNHRSFSSQVAYMCEQYLKIKKQ